MMRLIAHMSISEVFWKKIEFRISLVDYRPTALLKKSHLAHDHAERRVAHIFVAEHL